MKIFRHVLKNIRELVTICLFHAQNLEIPLKKFMRVMTPLPEKLFSGNFCYNEAKFPVSEKFTDFFNVR